MTTVFAFWMIFDNIIMKIAIRTFKRLDTERTAERFLLRFPLIGIFIIVERSPQNYLMTLVTSYRFHDAG